VNVHDARAYEEEDLEDSGARLPSEVPRRGVLIVMERLHGKTLREWAQTPPSDGGPDQDARRRALAAAGRGLLAANEAGLTHCDFKPDNVVVLDDGTPKILDFGLASNNLDGRSAGSGEVADLGGRVRAPSVKGTPAYMAPEQHIGGQADARSDQFAFAASAYEVLTGERPFAGSSLQELARQKRLGKIRWPDSPRLPAELTSVLEQAMQPAPADRLTSLAPLIEALEPSSPNRRWGALLGAALLMVAVGFGANAALGPTDGSERCDASSSLAVRVWNEDIRTKSRRAFAASERPYANQTWARAESSIGAFIDGWVARRDDACAATHLRAEQSTELLELRVACYDRKLEQMGAIVEVFSTADQTVVDHAAQAAVGLPSLEGCADPISLRRRVPEPSDEVSQEKISAIRAGVARGRALKLAGKLEDSDSVLDEQIADARKLGYEPLLAEALIARGQRWRGGGNEARDLLFEAATLARASGVPEFEVKAWTELIWRIGVEDRNADVGEWYAEYAANIARMARMSDEPQRHLDAARAAVAATGGDLEQALTLQRGIIESLKRDAVEELRLLGPMNNLGNTLYKRGDLDGASEAFSQALQIANEQLGNDHPITLRVRTNVAMVRSARGERETLLPDAKALVEAKIRILGQNNIEVADAYARLSLLQYRVGHIDDARKSAQQSLEMFTKSNGEDHPRSLEPYTALATIEYRAGNFVLAEEHVAKALKVGAGLGEDNPLLAESLALHGELRLRAGDATEAVESLEQAVASRESAGGDEVVAPSMRYNLARALLERGAPGDRARAKLLAERAVREFESHPDDDGERGKAESLALQLRDPATG
jgi:tetratricopeptide (TPR) repeat protein